MGKTTKIVSPDGGVTDNTDVVQKALEVFNPKRQFLISSMNMGWQLAGAVLIPVFIGAGLDNHFDSSPSYTLAALVIAAGGAASIVWNTIKQVSKEQKEADKKEISSVK